MSYSDIGYFVLYNGLYMYYIESNKGTQGVLFRPDSDGNKRLAPWSYLNFISQPINVFKPRVAKAFWEFRNLDINYLAVSSMAWSLKYGVEKIITLL